MLSKRFSRHFKTVTVLLISLCIFLVPINVSAAILAHIEPGVEPSTVKEIQGAADAFDGIRRDILKASWSSDVHIFICPDRQSFLETVKRELPNEKNSRNIENTIYAVSSISAQSIFVDQSNKNQWKDYERAEILGGFLFRLLSFQLNNNTKPDDITVETQGKLNYLHWMNEGFNHYIGALVSESLGLRSVAKWKRERILELRGLFTPMTLQEAQILSVGSWANFISQKASYKCDLLVVYLLETMKNRNHDTITHYYKLSSDATEIIPVWESVMDQKYNSFIYNFVSWYNREVLLL